jgi:transcriptional regulator with XRE-family HTH domain
VSIGSSKKTTDKLKVSARHLLAVNLVRLRAARKWSQDTLALEAGLHRTFVAHVERETRNISLDNLERLALALDVPVARLLQKRASKKADEA